MEKVDKGSVSATRSVLRFTNKAGKAVTDFAAKTVKRGAVALAGLATGFLALDNVTEEYRAAQGKLNTAYEAAGYSAQTAATAYREFYKILGDTDTATEGIPAAGQADPQRAGRDPLDPDRRRRQRHLRRLPPIEGLIEATNETAKTAKVTGVLADALNWVGISEDDFNKRLERCSGEAERNKLLMDTLTTAYEGAADAFYRNNEELVRARANQAAVSAVTAKLGSAAQTAKGWIWQLLGAQEDGSLRAGSALDWLSQRADGLMQKFQQWSQDGTVTRLAQQFDQGLAKGIDMASAAFQWVVDNGDTIQRVLIGVGSALAAVKILKFASDTITAVQTVQKFISVGSTFLAANPIYLGIMAAIAAGALLIANWDKVKATAIGLWEGAKQVFGGIRDSVTGAFDTARESVSGFFSWIGDRLSWLDETVEGIPILGSVYSGVKSVGGWVVDKLRGNALGTSYFSGGLTRVNERGGEIIDLPSGTQIIPHDVSLRMAEQTAGSSVVHLVGGGPGEMGRRGCAAEIRELLRQLVRRRSRGDVR